MRKLGLRGGKKVITATPRQLESLIRLSEAHAKLHLRAEVGVDDVREAIRLVKVATQQAATDPKTGTIDMNLLTTGVPTQAFEEGNAADDFGADDF
jgi:DNA replication licensing factor MCM4